MPTKRPVWKLLDAKLWNASQSWSTECLYDLGGKRVRTTIRRNAYDEQSHINAYLWSPDESRWNLAVSIPFALAPKRLKSLSYVSRAESVSLEDFAEAEQQLLRQCELVLLGVPARRSTTRLPRVPRTPPEGA